MKYTIKRKKDLTISYWSGGSTTEFFIYPKTSHYQDRNFEIRISSATVDVSPSNFTVLSGYHRLLMPINTSLTLVFDDKNKINIDQMKAVEFEGSLKTVSYGLCTDIGIMLSPKWIGKLINAESGIIQCVCGFTCIYALNDNLKIIANKKNHILYTGDIIIFESKIEEEIELIFNKENSAIIISAQII